MKILIADDHPIVRNGIKQIISDISESYSIDEAEDANEVVQKVSRNDYDFIILDISMPKGGGLFALEQIKRIKPQTKVLILSIFNNEQYIFRAMNAGASGYLTKASATEELGLAIEKILSGRKYFSSEIIEKMATVLNSDFKKPKHDNLSEREFQIFCLLAHGKTTKEIAKELFISPKTVSTYYYRILNKMEMEKNSEIIHYAIKNGLIDTP
jgi:two-component system, NarL family, invasion response regulator UvrY